MFVYGRKQIIRYKTFCAQWYRASPTRLLRIVIVATDRGAVPIRVFFSTDASLGVTSIIAGYGARWSIECFFREAKQLLGFADSSARKEHAVLRVAPFVGLLYTTLVVWFIEGACNSPVASPPLRPWYRHKRGLSFEDILRAARRTLYGFEVLVPCRDSDNLHQLNGLPENPECSTQSRAAQGRNPSQTSFVHGLRMSNRMVQALLLGQHRA